MPRWFRLHATVLGGREFGDCPEIDPACPAQGKQSPLSDCRASLKGAKRLECVRFIGAFITGSWSQCTAKCREALSLSLHEPQSAAGILPAEEPVKGSADATSGKCLAARRSAELYSAGRWKAPTLRTDPTRRRIQFGDTCLRQGFGRQAADCKSALQPSARGTLNTYDVGSTLAAAVHGPTHGFKVC
jgi:hypothetical protein